MLRAARRNRHDRTRGGGDRDERGVGRAAARAFAARKDTVALLVRRQAGLGDAALDVERLGGRALAIPTDVASYDEVEAAADRVERDLRPG
ncbi:SDR family NAD(P)-dependent oxidoreductase [Promicromonospora sp. NPDC023987]|uniref:SDR family NAD(P)-dependent oxidoreductase n=1 Tax=Promicromonospora sp. NPDC023987 TaxID=3155360 RepID=UPI0033E89E82